MLRELQPGDPQVMGPYRLRSRLGQGGMGQVFLGISAGGRLVAVKIVRADLATDPEFRARFRREVAVARTVSGQFTAPVIDADLDCPTPWLATAYVAGPSLAEAVVQHGPLPASSVLKLAAGLAEGLTAIHTAGVVHRDLKPANVLLADDGPRLIDFGICVAAASSPLTRMGFVVGSPGYMSPEQAEGRPVGPASDIFGLGAILAFAATGEAPFGTGSAPTLAYRAVHDPANLDRVPAEVRALIDRCLAKDPGRRPTAAGVLAEAGATQPLPGWLPERLTRAFTALQDPTVAAVPYSTVAAVPGPSVAAVPYSTVAAVPGPSVAAVPGPTALRGPTALPAPTALPGPSAADPAWAYAQTRASLAQPGSAQTVTGASMPPGWAAMEPRGDLGDLGDRGHRGDQQDRPGRRLRRGLWRPLAVASLVAGIVGASAAAGFALTSNGQPSVVHSPRMAAAAQTTTTTTTPAPSATPSIYQPARPAPSTTPATTTAPSPAASWTMSPAPATSAAPTPAPTSPAPTSPAPTSPAPATSAAPTPATTQPAPAPTPTQTTGQGPGGY
jgi:eukaryotic-like serine/threonine-protein kinase